MYDAQKSKIIFDELMNGRVINKHKLDNDARFVENELYQEVIINDDEYKQQYRMSGYYLDIKDSYITIKDADKVSMSLKSDVTMKVCILLLIIAKYLNENNYRMSKLTSSESGINLADIEAMEEMTDVKEILEKADMKKSLFSHFKSILVDRNIILEKAGCSTYLLSDVGKAFFNEISVKFYDAHNA